MNASVPGLVVAAAVELQSAPCGVCGASDFKFLFQARDYLYGNAGSWPVGQCRACRVVAMNPRIPPERIGAYYPSGYYTQRESPGAEGASWKRLLKDYAVMKLWGYPPTSAMSAKVRIVGAMLLPFVRRWHWTLKFARREPGGRILDVGCGNGAMLNEYRRVGWETHGVELNERSAEFARSAGHQVWNGELKGCPYRENFFDAITFWDSLEHIHDPADTVRKAAELLRPGGLILVSVPNYGSWYARSFKDRWFMFTAPIHYYHYTKRTLLRLLSASFTDIRINTPLGDAGLAPTLEILSRGSSFWHRILRLRWSEILLRAVDYLAPSGHLLAVGRKPGSPRAA